MHPIPDKVRRGRGGTAAPQRAHALRAVKLFAWLEVGSVKAALSRPGRAPGWCPIPPTSPNQSADAIPRRTMRGITYTVGRLMRRVM